MSKIKIAVDSLPPDQVVRGPRRVGLYRHESTVYMFGGSNSILAAVEARCGDVLHVEKNGRKCSMNVMRPPRDPVAAVFWMKR